ncbi:Outer membrane protein assembly factor BamA [Nymphon striatum]|nr:Outer membrane protein assembly factor BamA [Nymphon striatum]
MSIMTLKVMGRLITGEASLKNISGPITIANYAGKSALIGFSAFLTLLAIVSLSLGVLNLLPIPMLDGGHLLYYIIELVKGSPVSERVEAIGMRIGMSVVLQASMAGCLFAISHGAWADSFILNDVQVSGLERIAAGTVLSNVPVRVGEKFDDRMTANLVRSLYKTGFFDDVKLLLSRQGIAKGRPLDKSALNRIQHEIKQQYLARGNYGADVATNIEKLPRNRVAVKIKVTEGAVAKIKRIKISGNKAYSEARLTKLLESGPKSKLSVFSSKDKYAKEKLVGDIDKLTSFYRDRGYLNFEVVSTQVSLSKDKSAVFVNINIHEGDQYRIGKVNVAGNSGINSKELKRLSSLKEGEVFSQTKLSETRNNLKKRMGKDGYAFSRIGILPQVDKVNKRVNLVFQAEKGQRTYVRRINIRGNFRTKDEVFRREMRQLESSFLSKEKVDRSKQRIQRLPFVESVKITTSPVAGRSDQVDLDVIVSEQSSNQFNAGLGYSQSNGLLFNVGVKQNNFMGTGKSLSVSAAKSDSTVNGRLSYNNPYHTVDGVGRGFNVFYEENEADEDDVSDYSSDAYGADINYTIPLTEDNSLRFSIGAEHREIQTSDNTPDHINEFINKYGDSYDNFLGKRVQETQMMIPMGGSFAVDARAELQFPVPFAADVKGLRMSAFVDAGNVYKDYDAFEGR